MDDNINILNIINTDNTDNKDNTSKLELEKINCEVCNKISYKYKCPKCLTKSCSLICVKQHKLNKKCNGIKDKFSKNKNLTEKDFFTDVRYMTDMYNETNSVSKKLFLQTEDQDERKLKEKKQKNFKKLCKKFRSVNLIRCPIYLDRFIENQSYCDSKEKKFYWTIRFNIISTKNDIVMTHIIKNPIDDSLYSLRQILEMFFENKSELSVDQLLLINNVNKDKIDRISLLYPLSNEEWLQLNEDKKVIVGNSYYEICNDKLLLREFLKDRTLYEYLILYFYIL